MPTIEGSPRTKSLRQKQIILPVLILVIAAIAFVSISKLKKPPAEKEEKDTTPIVEVSPVTLTDQALWLKSQGIVSPRYLTRLVAQVSGEIVHLSNKFNKGEFVKKGALLARIDPSNYESRVAEAEAGLASALAAYELEQAQVAVAEAEWKNLKNSNVRPTALSLRKPQLKQAQARVDAARSALAQAKKDLSRTEIVAPYDALVDGRDVSLASYVVTGAQLGVLLDTRVAEVRLPIAASDFQYIGEIENRPVILTTSLNEQAETWQGRALRSEGVVDNKTRMQYLVVEIEDPYGLRDASKSANPLVFGSYVNAKVKGIQAERTVRIPRRLIREGKVAVYHEGKLNLKSVEVLRNEASLSVVKSGLEDGDLLVTSALDLVIEGMALSLSQPKGEEQNKDDNKGELADG